MKTKISAFAFTMFLAIGCGNSGSGKPRNPQNPLGNGPMAVSLTGTGLTPTSLGSASAYVILAKAGIANNTGSAITGDVGVSPAAATYFTGFSLSADASNVFSSSIAVIGKVYAANYAFPTPSNLTSAISAMESAYLDAAGRTHPDFNNFASGDLGGLTLAPGLYKWGGSVFMPSNVTISGTATDVWIFQVDGDLSMAGGVSIILAGGALPQNIFWQVAGQVDIMTSAHFEGIILGKTAVNLQTNASLDGRIYSQTEVALDDNVVTQP